MDLDRQTRREFCSRTCSTAALAALGGVLASVQVFVHPCHGARFDTSGRVLSGPAPTAPQQYQAQLAASVLTISA